MEHLIKDTESALDFLFQSARRTPADKLDWSPTEHGRNTLDQLQECANTPDM